MSRIGEFSSNAVTLALAGTLGVAAVPIAPLISALAVPFFASRALVRYLFYRPLYERTLNEERTREPFGRIAGQDYTQWDGKALLQAKSITSESEQLRHKIEYYEHGTKQPPGGPQKPPSDCPFKTAEDLDWLTKELAYKEQERLLYEDLIKVRGYSKGLIPAIGLIWAAMTETNFDGAFSFRCICCAFGDDKYWFPTEALAFHREALRDRLNHPSYWHRFKVAVGASGQ